MANLETIISSLEEIKQTVIALDNRLNNDMLRVGTSSLTSINSKFNEVKSGIENAKTELSTIKSDLATIENRVKNGG